MGHRVGDALLVAGAHQRERAPPCVRAVRARDVYVCPHSLPPSVIVQKERQIQQVLGARVAFCHADRLVGVNARQDLDNATRPLDLDPIDVRGCSQPELGRQAIL